MIYNEFRPQIFDQVFGQEVPVKIIRNQIISGNVANAWLFVGIHGTGKTTVAKIFAKALNCKNPQNGNPCNQCESCQSYDLGKNFDIIEIDGASNNSVDDIRKLQEQIVYSPQRKKKVYIIDEVHMLSKGAFNALLKTLEEPPSYVVFILCTTEIDKVPQTIKSRCVRLDFSRISTNDIFENLDFICLEKEIDYEEEGLKLIARLANGSMRDALSMLEKCISYGELTYKNINNVLGIVDMYTVMDIMKLILSKKPLEAIDVITKLYNKGKDMLQLSTDLLKVMRNIMVLQTTTDSKLFDIDITPLKGIKINPRDCYLAINELSNLQKSIKNSDNQKVLMDVAIIQLSEMINAKIIDTNIDNESNTKLVNNTNQNLDKIDHNNYLINKIDLIKSYDINSEELTTLINAKIYTRKDAFVIITKKSNLDINDIKNRMKKITGKELNIVIKSA